MLKLEINIDRACRSCLEESDSMLKVQDSLDIDSLLKPSVTIAEILMECTEIKIMPDDELPQSICTNCVKKVQDAFSYKKMCEESDEKLRMYLNQDIKGFIQNDEYEISSVLVPELVNVTDAYVRDDLFDENFDDDHFDAENLDGDVFEMSPNQSDCETEAKEPNSVTKEQYRKGEDFRLVNNAKRVNGRYQCGMCEKTLADRRTFLLHTRLHLGKNLKHCDVCGKGFAKKNHLDRHKLTHSAKPKKRKHTRNEVNSSKLEEPSQKCPKKIEIESTRETTVKICKEEEPSESSLNDSSVTAADDCIKDEHESMNANKSRSIGIDEDEQRLLNSAKMINDRLQCPICPRTLSQRKILKLHIRSHLGKNLLHCKICNRGFAKGSNLNRHMLLHCTIDNDEENQIIQAATQTNGCYSCPFCAKTLIDRQTFRLHIRLHISKGLLRCEICNRGFEDADELQKHMTSHGNEFTCNHCSLVFNTFGERKSHLREVHSNEMKDSDHTVEITEKPKKRKKSDDCDDDEDKYIVKESNCVNGRFECVFCKKTLANRTTLKYHIRLHLGKHLLKCEICNQGFSKKSHLKRHFATHAKKKPCRHCDAVFETYDERKIHTAAVHKDVVQNHTNKTIIPAWTQANGQKQCICMLCDMTFGRISDLQSHLNWHTVDPSSIQAIDFTTKKEMFTKFNHFNHDNQDFAAILQNALRPNSGDLTKMYCITNEHGWELSLSDSETENDDVKPEICPEPKYRCSKCGQHFNRLHKLMCHMKCDHECVEFQEFKCSHCMQHFPNQTILEKHLRQQCENNSKTIVCSMCNNRFAWKSSLDKHVAIYHEADSKYICDKQTNIKPFNCDKCVKSFYRIKQLEAHQSSHVPRQKRFSCDICKKCFSRTDNLKSHMRVHIPMEEREITNKHLCSYCGRSFSNSSNLNVHIRRHTNERPFSCEFCNARFPRSSDLQCHRRTHTGEKTCVCTVCGKGFTRSNKLVRHMRIHTGERPYKCQHCDRAFTQSNDLTLHVRRLHTGEKPFGCYCGERFITNSLLQVHRRTTGHMEDSTGPSTSMPSNSVNNPHRKFNPNDGKRTGITAALSSFLNTEHEMESDATHFQKL